MSLATRQWVAKNVLESNHVIVALGEVEENYLEMIVMEDGEKWWRVGVEFSCPNGVTEPIAIPREKLSEALDEIHRKALSLEL